MTGTPLVVIGAAGTGRETLDIIEAQQKLGDNSFTVAGVIDDSPAEVQLARLERRGIPFLGGLDSWLSHAAPHAFAIGVSAPSIRRRIAIRLEKTGHHAATLIHPSAEFGSQVTVGSGSIVYGGVRLTTNISIGRFALLNAGAIIGHDAILEDFVSVNPAATLSGEVRIRSDVLIGGGATVLQGLTVGAGAVVGARALVTRNVPPAVTVKGIPGRWLAKGLPHR